MSDPVLHEAAARALRDDRGVTIVALAERMDVDRGYLNNVLLGHVRLTNDMWTRLTRALSETPTTGGLVAVWPAALVTYPEDAADG